MQCLYLIAAILGTVLPLCFFVPFLMTHRDVFVSSFVLWLFVFSEGRRHGMKNLGCYFSAICCLVYLRVCHCSSTFESKQSNI